MESAALRWLQETLMIKLWRMKLRMALLPTRGAWLERKKRSPFFGMKNLNIYSQLSYAACGTTCRTGRRVMNPYPTRRPRERHFSWMLCRRQGSREFGVFSGETARNRSRNRTSAREQSAGQVTNGDSTPMQNANERGIREILDSAFSSLAL